MENPSEYHIDDAELRELGQLGQQAYAVPIPFGAIDAALWQYLSEEAQNFPFQRQGITSGSARYRLVSAARQQEIGSIQIQMINEVVTTLSIVPGALVRQSKEPDVVIGYLKHVRGRFIAWFSELHNWAVEEAEKWEKTPGAPIPQTPLPEELIDRTIPRRQGGPKEDEASNRAYARLKANEDHDMVYRDWLQERGENALSADVRERWQEAFYKAMGRRRKKEERRTNE